MSRVAVMAMVLSLGARARAEEPKELAVLKGHEKEVYSAVFSPDGKLLYSAGFEKTIRVWDVEGRKEVRTIAIPNTVYPDIVLSPDGKTLAVQFGADDTALYDAETGKERFILKTGYRWTPRFAAFSPDGKTVATGDKGVKLWDATTGKERKGPPGLAALQGGPFFTADGKSLVVGRYHNNLDVVNLATGKITADFKMKNRCDGVAVTPDGKTLVVAKGNTRLAHIVDLATKKDKASLELNAEARSLALSPDGNIIAIGTTVFGKNLQLWDVESGKQLAIVKDAHDGGINSVAFSPDGKLLATAGSDKVIKLWTVPER
jgi:WD40 repeat protein